MNTSDLFNLNWSDVAKGLVVAVFAAVITYLAALVQVPGFDLTTINWQGVLSVAVIAGISYLGKNFVSDSNGKVLGAIG